MNTHYIIAFRCPPELLQLCLDALVYCGPFSCCLPYQLAFFTPGSNPAKAFTLKLYYVQKQVSTFVISWLFNFYSEYV